MNAYILGISAYHHDSAAALVQGGRILAAAQEERFSRIRHDAAFPKQAVLFCLEQARITLDEVATVVYYEDAGIDFSPRDSIGSECDALASVQRELEALGQGRAREIRALSHQRSHAASAFYPSPFENAAILSIDGIGQWQTTTLWHGRGNSLEQVSAIPHPHLIGLLYSAFTDYCGFKVDSGEYKLMGLAPYGKPIYADLIRRELVTARPDGSFTLNRGYFGFLHEKKRAGQAFERLFGGPARSAESALTQRECDLAASVQKVTEELVCALARNAARQTGERHLCLAGSVALNCAANGVLSRARIFESIWVQPAAGDAGGALGAALDAAVPRSGRPHLAGGTDAMQGAFLGPAFSDEEIAAYLEKNAFPFERHGDETLYDCVAEHLARGAVVGWFQGRMEFGPRALGARSILGDPRDPAMQKKMNLKIKFRESFRPFAPSVLQEDAAHYFDIAQDSPYMVLVAPVSEHLRHPSPAPGNSPNARLDAGLDRLHDIRSELPAITHVDFSARVQTVSQAVNPRFAQLLRRFKHKTGCPVLVNTSFNVRGEPIVCTPEQAYACLMRTHIDVLVLGSYVLHRSRQPAFEEQDNWRERIPLD